MRDPLVVPRPSRRFATTAALLAAAVATAFGPARPARASAADAPIVRTASGPVGGTLAAGVASYEGIPYAAPPVGPLRWKPPAAPAPWTSPLAGSDFGPSCPQQEPPRNVPPSSRAATTSEDCLTLNVWTPQPHGTKMPVMVWIHGGGNDSGSSAQTYYDGTAFARDGVVLVSLNYRLGLLGFFAHPALTAEAKAAAAPAESRVANYGLMDQMAALAWVRDNVAAFGGDPANVTVFGESAGGEDAVMLDSMPAARGLFARVIAESAATIQGPFPSLAHEEASGTSMVRSLGIVPEPATPAQLRAIPLDRLLKAKYSYTDVGPIEDGTLVAGTPAEAFARHPGVPLVIGTNDGEFSLLPGDAKPHDVFPELSKAQLATLRAAYAHAGFAGVADDAAFTRDLFRDVYFAAPAREVARSYAAGGVPAYLYRFDYVASFFAGRRTSATHGSDIPYVFESFSAPGILSPDDRAVQSAMHACWVAFAKTGAPACPGLSGWTPYDARGGRVMVIDAHPSLRDPGTNAVFDAIDGVERAK